jgi:heme exporter protein CcmD
MNPWPFVIAAYAVAMIAVAVLILWSLASMRRAEAAADKLRQ